MAGEVLQIQEKKDKRYRGKGIKKIREIEKQKNIDLTGRLVFLKGRSTNGFLVRKVNDRETETITYLESLEGELVMYMSEQIDDDVFLVKEEYGDLVMKIVEISKNSNKAKSYLGRVINEFSKIEKNDLVIKLFVDLYVYYMTNRKRKFKETIKKIKAVLI